ncbi:arylsulfatase [Ilumatobacter sp.]|uniref:arylsulfatase n=1 Tax=Ilumatobacter sp. TaxID=1967498 RepID=UPI0037537A38
MTDPRGAGSSTKFEGVIGRDLSTSQAWYPPERTPGPDAPNVVVVILDDTGFAHLGCYGSDIDTKNVDALAAGGLRFNNFHTTALCSPTRAALLTGRNHHDVGMRFVSNVDAGFPNSRGALSTEAVTLAEVLRGQGYGTYALGKWHLANMADCGPTGPFDHWPVQRGFDRYYGFLGGATDQFAPELVSDNQVLAPRSEAGYHVSEDLVDQAIAMTGTHCSLAPERPFFCYLAFGATHSPHQAPTEFLEKYRGRYDEGWDVIRKRWFERQLSRGIVPAGTELAPRNPGVPAWEDVPEPHRRLFARMQESFAGFLDHTDVQIGRFIGHLRALEVLDNTIVIVLSDNGASQEGGHGGTVNELRFFNRIAEDIGETLDRLDDIGGPLTYSDYPKGWAQVGNTPLRFYKQNTYEGGIRDPFVIHWPNGIVDAGAIRTQYQHVVDVMPTLLECIGIDAPTAYRGVEQRPMAGISFTYALRSAAADEPTRRTAQYYEMLGHRAIWSDGWKAVTMHRQGQPFDDDEWALYHIDEDFSESHDLAAQHPEIVAGLVDLWWTEAERNGVLPLDDRSTELFALRRPGAADRVEYRFPPTLPHLERTAVPDVLNRSYRISTVIERTEQHQGGVIVALGSSLGGYVLYVHDGRLVYEYNHAGTVTRIESNVDIPTGSVEVEFGFQATDEHCGIGVLCIGDTVVGTTEFSTLPFRQSLYGLDVGRDLGLTVSNAYVGPNEFQGRLGDVTYHLGARRGVGSDAAAAELRSSMVEQ